jgi:hypothetical protein
MRNVWSLDFDVSWELGACELEFRARPRLASGDRSPRGDADRVLIKSREPAFALQVLQVAANRAVAHKFQESMTHDRPSPQNAFVGWGFGRRNGELIDRH